AVALMLTELALRQPLSDPTWAKPTTAPSSVASLIGGSSPLPASAEAAVSVAEASALPASELPASEEADSEVIASVVAAALVVVAAPAEVVLLLSLLLPQA